MRRDDAGILEPTGAPDTRATLRFGPYELDPTSCELRRDGERVPIEPRGFDILSLLAAHGGRTVTKDEIFRTIWGRRFVSDAALSSQIKAVRQALGDDGTSQHTIATVHGRGFRFLPRIEPSPEPAPTPAPRAEPEPVDGAVLPARQMRPVVAVLPFDTVADGIAWLGDGLAEAIISALTRHRSLAVIARSPSFAFRGCSAPVAEMAEKLGVRYVVEGSVRMADTRLRVTVELVDAQTSRAIWSTRDDCCVADVFSMQEELSGAIAARIATELGLAEQRRAARAPRKNVGAWELYQLATADFYAFTAERNRVCRDLLRRALALDPDFPEAHSRLAYAIVLGMAYFENPVLPGKLDEALALARRAVRLDDRDADAWFTLGRVHLARRDYGAAIETLIEARELNPCLALTYCGLGDACACDGRFEEAIGHFEAAIALSPHDPFRWAFFSYRALAHLFRGEHEEAALWSRRAVAVPNAHYAAKLTLMSALGHLGDEGAIAPLRADLERVRPGLTCSDAAARMFYVRSEEQLGRYIEGLARAGIP